MEKESDYVLLQSQTIDWLRFPLAVAVVFIHSFGYPLTYTLPALNIHSFSGMDVYNVIRICFSHVEPLMLRYRLFFLYQVSCFL